MVNQVITVLYCTHTHTYAKVAIDDLGAFFLNINYLIKTKEVGRTQIEL